mgnify:CR=1 FL=1
MEWYTLLSELMEKGKSLGGDAGLFFQIYSPYVLGTLLFIFILYVLRKVPYVKALHDYALAESAVDKDESEFLKLFESATRIKINFAILLGLIFLMVFYSVLVFATIGFPFLVWSRGLDVSLFGVFMMSILALFLEFWCLWLLNRNKEQVSRAIRLEKENA